MIKIDDKEIRNPIEQIKKNMDDIEKLKDQIYEVYNYNGVIGSTEIPYVNRSSTNVPENVNKGWLVDYTGKLFKITGGNTTTLLLDYYANIKGNTGATGPQGPEGPQGDPGVGIVSITKTSTSGLVDTYTIVYTNGQLSTFTVTNGEKGDPGAPGPTYNAGDNIQINNSTKIISANENIIPKTNYGYDLGSSTKLYKNVYAGGLKNTYFNILTGGVNGHGTAILSTTNAQGTTEGSLRLDYNKIQVNQKLVPSSNNTLDLGASYSKFDKIYVNTLSDGTNTIDVADIGTGSEYTAGDGIDITNDVISVDTDTVALKSDIPDVSNFVTNTELSTTLDDYELKADAFSGDYTDLTNKPTIPTVEANSASTPTDTLTNININGTVYNIQGGGSGNSSSGIYLSSADLDTTVNYNKIILISTITLGSNTLAVDDIIIGANKYVGVVTTIGVNPNNQPVAAVKTLGNITDPDLSSYVTTTSLSTTLQDYELKADAFSGDYDDLTNKPDLSVYELAADAFSGDYDDLTDKPDLSIYAQSANLATVATSGDYDDLTDKPDLSNFVTSSDLQTELQNYVESSDLATVATSGEYSDLIGTPTLATVATTGDYDDLIDKPVIPEDVTILNLRGNSGTLSASDLAIISANPEKVIINYNDSNGASGTYYYLYFKNIYNGVLNEVDYNTYQFVTQTTIRINVLTGAWDTSTSMPYVMANTGYTPTNTLTDLKVGVLTYKIPAAQVNSDWNAVSGVAQILNKPSLATVATTGDYDDLINKPTIPEAAYIIEITYGVTSGTLSAVDLAALIADPTNVIFKTTWSGGFGYVPFQESDSNGSSIVYGIYWYNGANYAYHKITVNTSTGAWTTGGATFPTASTLATYIQKSSTAGLVKNDGTIDTNTYLTTAPVTSVNGQTGAVSLTIPTDVTIITLSGTSGTLTAEQIALIQANPDKVIIKASGDAYNYYHIITNSLTIDYMYETLLLDAGAYSKCNRVSIYENTSNPGTYNYIFSTFNVLNYDYTNHTIAGDTFSGTTPIKYKTNSYNTYGANFPDTTNYTADKTIATTDDIPDTIGEVLFNNGTGSNALSITLSKSLSNYNCIDIQYINNDNIINCARIYDPDGKRISLINIYGYNTGTPEYINKAALYYLSGTSMTQVCKVQGTIRNNAASGVSYNSDTQISGLIKITKVIGYKNNASPQIISQPMYEDGDKFVNTYYCNAMGYITSGRKEITFTITVPKSLDNISSITVNKCQCLFRGVAGYVNGTSNIDYANTTGYTVTATKAEENMVTIMIQATNAYSDATNNTVVNIAFVQNGGIELTFNE